MIRLGIIGIAGRKPSHTALLAKDHMTWMADNVKCYIKHVIKTTTENILLVSGGSAWCDHIAVQLYLDGGFGGLELFLPTNFDLNQRKYIDSREGKILNYLHMQCQKKPKRKYSTSYFWC